MPTTTNSLRDKARRFAVPSLGVAAVGLLSLSFFTHNSVHAAAIAPAAPLDDSNVTSLIALDNAVEAVAARVTPAVVNVSVTSRGHGDPDGDSEDGQNNGLQNLPPEFRRFFGFGGQGPMQGMPQQQQVEHGIGSGVILSPDGYILTNNHVVDGSMKINVTLDDRRIFPAKLVGVDKLNDLAVIKVDAHDLPTIAWGDSTKLHPGQTVLAFGSPFGLFQFSVTRGIVSALDRPNPYTDDPRKPGDFIQTDAAINQGNSGGPLVNAHGELVGINTFIITNSGSFAGAGFAIPSQIARTTAEQLIAHGKVEHGYLGISMNDVTPANAHFFNLDKATGAIVAQVSPDSPANHGGVKTGDVIDELNGRKIVNGSALQVAVSQMTPGTKIELGVIRDGKPVKLNLTVGEFKGKSEVASRAEGDGPQSGKLGLAVSDLTPEARRQNNVPDHVNGVLVENVRPASPAEDAGIQPGDIILEVNRKPAGSASEFSNQVRNDKEGRDILLLVWSHGNSSYRTVHTDQTNDNG